MKNLINNILPYKALSRLPQEGGFNSGDCPGAAAITNNSSLFSSPWGTLGRKTEDGRPKTEVGRPKTEDRRPKTEDRRRKTVDGRRKWKARSGKHEDRSLTGTPVSDFPSKGRTGLFPVRKPGRLISRQKAGQAYSLFPGFKNKEHRITLPGLLTGNDECRMMNDEPERNITVRCTSGFHAFSSATNIVGATHLGFQTADTAISGIAAAPRNTLSDNRRICRTAGHPSGKKVQSTETLKENKKYRISLPGLLTGKDECRMMNDEPERNITVRCTSGFHTLSSATNIVGATHLGFQTADTAISGIAAAPRNTLSDNRRICRTAGHPSGKKVQSTETLKENKKYRIFNIQYSTMNQNPLAETPSDRVIRAGRNFEPSGKKYKTLSRLPQEGGFYSGDIPGAAAITIVQVLFSSPRVSPNFAGARCYALSGLEPLSAYLPTNLPVKNRPETGVFPWYSHPAGRYSGQGTSSHPERQLLRTNQKGGMPMS